MATRNPGLAGGERTAPGWLPPAAKVGNVLLVPVSAQLACRLSEASLLDPFWQLRISAGVEDLVEAYVERVLLIPDD